MEHWTLSAISIGLIFMAAANAIAETSTIQPNNTIPTPVIITKNSTLCKRCQCNLDERLLDCSNKQISSWFDDEEWNTLSNGDITFETIRLEFNNLTSIPELQSMPVKNLYLAHNSITTIANSAFHKLLNLTTLDLSYNKLTSKNLRPEVFQGNYNPYNAYEPLEHLIELDLGNNELHSLHSDLFQHVKTLQTLILGSNEFHVIDKSTQIAVGELYHLKTLDMSYMELKTIPRTMLNSLRDLENLILTGNLFDKLPDALNLTTNLKRLTFDENPLTNLHEDNIFPDLRKLEYLSISYSNDIERIGKMAFSKLQSLKTVVLSNNPRLSYIHPKAFQNPTVNPEIFDYPPVEEIFLQNNNLTVLDHDLFQRWDKIKVIDLRWNPWICDCYNSWLINTLMTQIQITSAQLVDNVQCASPQAWKSKRLIELNTEKKVLRCIDNSHPEKDGHLLVGILIGVLIGIPLTLLILFVYRRGYLGILHRGMTPQPPYSRAKFQDDYHI